MHNLKNYETLLDFIMPVIDKKFEHQKEYLACSKGCALCCKTVSMPFSEIEFEYMKQGFEMLDKTMQEEVLNNIKNLIDENTKPACPFLKNDVCSIYKHRGLICRTFGLLLINDDGEYTVPFCVHKGLNYSKVFDEEKQQLSVEKIKEQGYENDPMYYTLNRQQFFHLGITQELGITPGESKPLIEWLKGFYKEKA